MPNWASTSVYIKCKSKGDRNRLMKQFNHVEENCYKKTDFGPLWLGNLLIHLGYSEKDVLDQTEYMCRGSIDYLEEDEDDDRVIMLDEETAWEPMVKVIKRFCDEYISGYSMTYTAVEYGMCMFISNRRDTAGKYVFDVYEDETLNYLGLDEKTAYKYYSEAEVKSKIKKALGYRETDHVSINTLINEAENAFDDFNINKFEYVPVEDLS